MAPRAQAHAGPAAGRAGARSATKHNNSSQEFDVQKTCLVMSGVAAVREARRPRRSRVARSSRRSSPCPSRSWPARPPARRRGRGGSYRRGGRCGGSGGDGGGGARVVRPQSVAMPISACSQRPAQGVLVAAGATVRRIASVARALRARTRANAPRSVRWRCAGRRARRGARPPPQ